jgi:hypothetical protein
VGQRGGLSADEIVELSKRYTLHDWQAQRAVAPMAVERAEGIYVDELLAVADGAVR